MKHSILHLDSEMTWRGGENQVRLLLENAQDNRWTWYVAAPPESQAVLRLAPFAKILPTPMRGLKQLSAARTIAQQVRAYGIELIDCQSSRAHQLGLLVKYFVPEVKLVVHRRVDYPPGSGWVNRLKYGNHRIDRFVAISSAIAEVLMNYGVPQAKISVVRSAVDSRPFQGLNRPEARLRLASELGFDSSRCVIGNVAYITEQKDHATLIRALGRLKNQGLKFFCFIAGDGHLRAAAEELARALDLGSSDLRFLGVRTDVPELLAASDVFALSSQDEGLGTSLLDAAHAGCALIATRVGGIPEIVLHEKTGLLAAAKDDQGFAEQLARVITNRDLRGQLVKGAQAHAAAEFSLESMVQGNLAVYRELIEPR